MKKSLFTLAMLIVSLTSFAEGHIFVLSPSGMLSTNPETPDYLIFDYPEFSQRDLYEKVLLTVGEHFTSPKDVLSTVENKQVSIACTVGKGVKRTDFHSFDISFKLVFEFKDNKIKVNAPIINKMTTVTHKYQEMFIKKNTISIGGDEFSIYNMKGKLKNEKAKKSLEYTVNSTILMILEGVLDKAVHSDW
ncbi:DUF4468 domain-containing protein [Parabacteroides timonensis]|uniref:DUF4468 domain-containing protein n=1 Tax=Parabacteroides timonensis TaxID=1871013 RepID=UPI00094E163D|nr:DUF4468 domain-containing protein [Parabacteroides timonensis]